VRQIVGDAACASRASVMLRSASSSSLVQLLSSPHLLQILFLLFSLSCCGSQVGLSRLLPRLASASFHIESQREILYFVAIFGLSKASFNLVAAQLAAVYSRRQILLLGWLLSLAAPLLILAAESWNQVLLSTAFFGASQGLLTSASVIMLMDRVSSRQRGVVNGLLECTIYCSMAVFTAIAGSVEERYGFRPVLPAISIAVSIAGLLSTVVISDTRSLVRAEEQKQDDQQALLPHKPATSPSFSSSSSSTSHVALSIDVSAGCNGSAAPASSSETEMATSAASALSRCFRRPHLLALVFAGFCNNFDDGVIWATLPAFYSLQAFAPHLITALLTAYPLVWGLLQVVTGVLADGSGRRKPMIVAGMGCQSLSFLLMAATATLAHVLLPFSSSSLPPTVTAASLPFLLQLLAAVLLGVGTALCYPVLQASVSDSVPARQRASTLGVYRLCRDSGYVAGGLLSGAVADYLSLPALLIALSALLMSAALYAQLRLNRDEHRK
jgi:MFS family permease